MKPLFIISCLFISINCFSQNLTDSDQKHNVADTTEPSLYCGSGYATLFYSETDKLFEKQYEVKYTIVGCVREYTVEQMSFHNKSIAQFLDRKFGAEWRAGLRPDVFGITN